MTQSKKKTDINPLLEAAKKDKKALIEIKNLSVKLKKFEIACDLRELEKQLFPESKESQVAKKEAIALNTLFRMVDLTINEKTCWLLKNVIVEYLQKKDAFSIKDAARIQAKCDKIFDI